jgi:Zn finger protein HypA/HybF involved in hydrogenase expression
LSWRVSQPGRPDGGRARIRPEAALHEFGIAHEIYRVCRESMRAHAPAQLTRVKVAVGELAAVEPDLLSFAWQAVVGEGPDAGAALEVDWRPARQHCPACRADKRQGEGSWLRVCLDCGAPLETDGGTELDVIEIELLPAGEETAR